MFQIFLYVASFALFGLGFYSCTEGISKPPYIESKSSQPGIAAEYAGQSITAQELEKGLETELFELNQKIYELKMSKLKELLLDQLLAKELQDKKISKEEYLKKNVYQEVKDKDIDQFIEERKFPKEQVNPEIKARIKELLANQKNQQSIEAWLAKKLGPESVKVYFEKPKRPVFNVAGGKAPFLGLEKAPVTIIEFSDFQCPHCAEGFKTLKKLKEKYKEKLTVYFKHFPLPMHEQAKSASAASMCAFEQGQHQAFWTFHDWLFTHQTELTQDQFLKQAAAQGLKTEPFKVCLETNKYLAYVNEDIEYGKSLGVASTPTFFINGKLVAGALPVEQFSQLIDEELASLQ